MRALFALLLCLFALPAAAQTLSERDRADVARVEAWLNSFRTLQARFLQVGDDGRTAEGMAYLSRPGRLRFEYDPPVPILVVADGTFLIFHDKELGQVDRVPLFTTPVSVLVREDARLTGRATVKRVERQPGSLRVTVFDTDRPREGELTLVFSEAPFTLRQWVVLDAQGRTTQVTLANAAYGNPLPASLFVFIDPSPADRSGARR